MTVVGKRTRGTAARGPGRRDPAPSSRLARFLVHPWRCLWAARGQRPDIVHFHDAEMLAVLPVARLSWPKARFVYDVHEDFANLMLIRDWLPRPIKPAVRRADGGVRKDARRLGPRDRRRDAAAADEFSHARVVAYNYPTARVLRAGAAGDAALRSASSTSSTSERSIAVGPLFWPRC